MRAQKVSESASPYHRRDRPRRAPAWILAAALELLSLPPPPPQLFDLPSQFVYLFFHAATPQLFDLPSQVVYLLPVTLFQTDKVGRGRNKALRHLWCLRRFKARWHLRCLRTILVHHLPQALCIHG